MNVAQRKKLAPRNKNVEAKKTLKPKALKTKHLEIFKDCEQSCEPQKPEVKTTEVELCAETTPENYWKNLAEERRISLEKALEENKDLSELLQIRNEEHKELEAENETLLEENTALREKAQKVNELESLIAELVSDATAEEEETEEDAGTEELEEETQSSPTKRRKSD